jgi:hypothetical protein
MTERQKSHIPRPAPPQARHFAADAPVPVTYAVGTHRVNPPTKLPPERAADRIGGVAHAQAGTTSTEDDRPPIPRISGTEASTVRPVSISRASGRR